MKAMPRKRPEVSWNEIRNLTERYEWTEGGRRRVGFNPPGGKDGKGVRRLAYHVRYITIHGNVEEGDVVTLKVFPHIRQRMIQFVNSRQIRQIRDYLIIEIDGIRIVTH